MQISSSLPIGTPPITAGSTASATRDSTSQSAKTVAGWMAWWPAMKQQPGLFVLLPLVLLVLGVLPLSLAERYAQWGVATEKYWDAVKSLYTIAGSLVAVWLFWDKLIGTRERAAKVTLKLTHGASTVPGATSVTHWLNVEITNVTTRALEFGDLTTRVVLWKDGAPVATHDLEGISPLGEEGNRHTTLDIGVPEQEHCVVSVPVTEADTLTFLAVVTVNGGTWQAFLTTGNQASPAKAVSGSAE